MLSTSKTGITILLSVPENVEEYNDAEQPGPRSTERSSHQGMDVARCQMVYGSGRAFRDRSCESIKSKSSQGIGPSGDETVHESFRFITVKKYGGIPEP